MAEATQILTEEHQGIKRVLALIEKAHEKVDSGQELPRNFLPEIFDFIKGFADTCHHGKEEGILFPLLEKRGIAKENGPIEMMLLDHKLGRNFVQGAISAFQGGDTKGALENLRKYVSLLKEHIDNEDNILYPKGNKLLTDEDQEYLERGFERIEKEKIGQGKHETYHQMIEKWEETL